MFGITDIWTYTWGVIFIVVVPGPNSLYVFSLAAQHGKRKAYFGILGVFVGDTILMLLAAAGTASLLHTHPNLFALIKCVGAAYLAWLGIKLIYATWHKFHQSDTPQTASQVVDATHPFSKGLLIDLLNPEAIIFFISFFAQFVDPHYSNSTLSFIILGTIMQTASMAYLSLLVFAGVWLAQLFHRKRWLTASAESGAGALFIGFGVKLMTGAF
jgi:leucine efflux protein